MTMLNRTPSRELREDLWVFPMDYPIKLMGHAGDELHDAVVEILVKHFPDFDAETLKVQSSRTGKYDSITANFTFQNLDQVHDLYADLAACEHIRTAL